jgi:hypothetical protein
MGMISDEAQEQWSIVREKSRRLTVTDRMDEVRYRSSFSLGALTLSSVAALLPKTMVGWAARIPAARMMCCGVGKASS